MKMRIVLWLMIAVLLGGAHTGLAQEVLIRPNACITVVGDSLAQGRQVVRLPGVNYFQIDTVNFVRVLDDLLNERRYYHIGIYDLTLPASGLVSSDKYAFSREYEFLLHSNCSFVIIFPWVNDLFVTVESVAPDAYSNAITALVLAIHENSPATHVVLMNYYYAPITDAGISTYPPPLTTEHVRTLNIFHENLCNLLDYVTCFDTALILDPIEDYVSVTIDLTEYREQAYQTVDINNQPTIYQGLQRGQRLEADGIHLNIEGKRRLADYLMEQIELIDPSIRLVIP